MQILWACEIEHLKAYAKRVLCATKEQEQAALAFFGEREPQTRQILTVEGDTATIDIRGTLTNERSFFADFLGEDTTSYIDLQEAIETIAADDTIKKVKLAIDSPGGHITGLDETWIALRELGATRQIVAENQGLMASAAYWIATAAAKITATSPAAESGSIGAYMLAIDYSKMDERIGIKEIRIVSKNAPLKNPDPATKEGLAAFQARLDALERVFTSRVAEGRGVEIETVEQTFGRGTLLVAQDPDASKPSALSVGMIDEVTGIAAGAGKKTKGRGTESRTGDKAVDKPDKTAENVVNGNNSESAQAADGKVKPMATIKELAEKDPELAAELKARDAAAEKRGQESAKPAPAPEPPKASQLALDVMAGDSPSHLKDIAAKVLKGESAEAELTAAQGAYESFKEEMKALEAAKETDGQGKTPAVDPPSQSEDGTIKTEEEHKAQVARFRAQHGMEAL